MSSTSTFNELSPQTRSEIKRLRDENRQRRIKHKEQDAAMYDLQLANNELAVTLANLVKILDTAGPDGTSWWDHRRIQRPSIGL